VFELYYGAFRSARPTENLANLERLGSEILAFDRNDARQAGEIRAILERHGTPIGGYDVLIAGQARARGLILVTSNSREFRRVPSLHLEDWSRPI
jgi:tRNA(fMet)-specific endonuclease VapC